MDCKITFSGRFHYRMGGGVALHQHTDDYQIQLVYGGSASIGVDDTRFVINSGDIVFLRKDCRHVFNVISPEGMKTLEIKFMTDDPDLIAQFDNIDTLFQDRDRQIFNIFSHIVLEGQRKVLAYKMMSNALLLESLVLMSRICSDRSVVAFDSTTVRPDMPAGKLSPVIESANEYIYRNINRNFSLKELADGCGYNQDYLYRTIKKELGMSAVQYVNHLRFEQAKRLIQHTELSLSEISWNLGFESLQYFSRFFKQHAKVSPSEYSAKVRKVIRTDY